MVGVARGPAGKAAFSGFGAVRAGSYARALCLPQMVHTRLGRGCARASCLLIDAPFLTSYQAPRHYSCSPDARGRTAESVGKSTCRCDPPLPRGQAPLVTDAPRLFGDSNPPLRQRVYNVSLQHGDGRECAHDIAFKLAPYRRKLSARRSVELRGQWNQSGGFSQITNSASSDSSPNQPISVR